MNDKTTVWHYGVLIRGKEPPRLALGGGPSHFFLAEKHRQASTFANELAAHLRIARRKLKVIPVRVDLTWST